jgi:histidinol phosphatase-like enzyme (inositol monophosphatase family)
MPQPSLRELLDVATECAYLAGRRSLAYFNAGVDVEHKGDDTPVTRADREAEHVIREVIHKFFPSHSILGEEHGKTVGGDPDYTWIVDPIDGTKSFIHGVPLYGSVVGCVVRGEPRVGAVYLPPLGDMFAAAEGEGATWNGRRCRVSEVDQLEDATVLAGSITRAIKRSDAYEKLADRARLNRGWGDVFGYMLVASGRAEVMLDPTISIWDIAGVAPIVREAGGFFGNWAGELTIGGPDACAVNGKLRDEVLGVLKNEKRRA